MRFGFILLLCGAAVAQAPVYKPAPIGTLKQVMRGVVLPNSDILFSVAQTPPKNDKEWAVVQDSAIAISESAALISMPGRLLSNGQKVPLDRPDCDQVHTGIGGRRRRILQSGAVQKPGCSDFVA